jgi:hypothetical protein
MTPSPQTITDTQDCPGAGHEYPGSIWQTPEQPSPGRLLPSSHISPVSMTPFPQIAPAMGAVPSPAQAAPLHPPPSLALLPPSDPPGVMR